MISADASVGYWLYRNDCQRGLTALVPTLEIHYQSQTEGDASRSFSDLVYGRYMTNLSLTAGITAIVGERLTASAALVTPLRSNIDIPAFGPLSGLNTDTARNYDAQLAVQVNYFYGAK